MSIDELTPESINFHTCKFRSEEEQERLIKRCSCQGGDYNLRGYWCEQRQIFQVTQEICATCSEYQHK
jgi:hypothetical protein